MKQPEIVCTKSSRSNNEIAIRDMYFQETNDPHLWKNQPAASKETKNAWPVLFADLSSVLRSALATFETPGSCEWFMCVFVTKQSVKKEQIFTKINCYLETPQFLRKKNNDINH